MIALVVPTIRELDEFFNEWEDQFFPELQVYVVEDRQDKTLELPKYVKHFCWRDIKQDLEDDDWVIPRYTSAIKSYGFYRAWKDGAEITIVLDDDCHPRTGDELVRHCLNLEKKVPVSWMNTLQVPYPRGFPYGLRQEAEVTVSHGLWDTNPDFDAPTDLLGVKQCELQLNRIVPKGAYYPMCGMNLAFKTKITPMMWFMLMGKFWDYDRFDDIWAGVVSKKIMDHLGYGAVSGEPIIKHTRKSNPFDNLIKEAKGIKENETFWLQVDKIRLTKQTIPECVEEFWQKFDPQDEEYFFKLKQGGLVWAKLFLS